ncbi:MAG: hypothetical protein N2491_06290 [Negativicutes bacterium]|nr:hypothetical protein [Negativicutes bacterium]
MFYKKQRRPLMDMGMDMDVDMMTVAKVLAASAMVYYGAKMIAEEIMD